MRKESASLLRELKELTGAAEWLLRFLLYFSHVGVQRAERLMRTDEESSVLEFTRKLRAIDYIGGEWRTVRAEYLQTLERIEDEASFALAALRQAMALDIHLASTPRAAETPSLLRDGRTYRLVQQNNFIGTAGEPTTGATRQGGEYRTYIQKFMLFEEHEQHGLRLRRRRFDDWTASADSRRGLWLRRALHTSQKGKRFRVRIEPLMTLGMHASLAEKVARAEAANQARMRIDAVDDSRAVIDSVLRCLAEARADEVTILVFPELCANLECQEAVLAYLRSNPPSWPALVVLGRLHDYHSCGDSGRSLRNRAILISGAGEIVHTHDKSHPYCVWPTPLQAQREREIAEDIDPGDEVAVLESPIGNILVLICLELFHKSVHGLVAKSHANLLLVPSFSHKTTAHQTAAKNFSALLGASTFVANHWPLSNGTSAPASLCIGPLRAMQVCKVGRVDFRIA
jgi:predicted amidohydrolase